MRELFTTSAEPSAKLSGVTIYRMSVNATGPITISLSEHECSSCGETYLSPSHPEPEMCGACVEVAIMAVLIMTTGWRLR